MKKLSAEALDTLDQVLHRLPRGPMSTKEAAGVDQSTQWPSILETSDNDLSQQESAVLLHLMNMTTPNESFDSLQRVDRYLEELRRYGPLP